MPFEPGNRHGSEYDSLLDSMFGEGPGAAPGLRCSPVFDNARGELHSTNAQQLNNTFTLGM